MFSRMARLLTAVFLYACFIPGPAGAHDLPLDRLMNAFVRIGPHQAELVVRVPLDLLRAVRFSLDRSGHYNLAETPPEVKTALAALGDAILIRENGAALTPVDAAGVLSPLADRSFTEYEAAIAHIAEPPDPEAQIAYELGYLDAHFSYRIASPGSVFTIQTLVAADLKDTAKLTIRYLPWQARDRTLLITSEDGVVTLDPPWFAASRGFIELGIAHILSGLDHMLFLLCLVIPFRRLRPLIPVVTAFTLGHSVTLIGTGFGLAPAGPWFSPLVETGIAASIVYMALENIVGADLHRRWIIAGLFGLVHGFGFSENLREQMQFAGSHLLVALLSFNIGIEIGQILVLCVFLAGLAVLCRGAMSGRMGVIVLSALVAHTAWHWMTDRADAFWQVPRPPLTMAVLLVVAAWGAALAVAVGLAVLLSNRIERRWPRFVQTAETGAD